MTPISLVMLAGWLATSLNLHAEQSIASDAKEISVKGALYISSKEGKVRYGRFDRALGKLPLKEIGFNWQKGQATAGVRMFFKTDSPRITLLFEHDPEDLNRGNDYGVFINGTFHKSYTFWKGQGVENKVVIDSGSKKMKEYEITLPTMSNPRFKGMLIAEGSKLKAVAEKQQKIYIAMGDSITHGQGQKNATYKTYPHLLAKKLDMDYYNLAVGGGKISMLAAKQLKDWKKIDLITVLIGYNDWVFDGKTPEEYKAKYREFLKEIRNHHQETKIFCISLLYTKTTESRKLGKKYQADDYRRALASLVKELQAEGDHNLQLIQGEKITSEKNLQGAVQPKDPVHLGIPGAKMLAEELYQKIIRVK